MWKGSRTYEWTKEVLTCKNIYLCLASLDPYQLSTAQQILRGLRERSMTHRNEATRPLHHSPLSSSLCSSFFYLLLSLPIQTLPFTLVPWAPTLTIVDPLCALTIGRESCLLATCPTKNAWEGTTEKGEGNADKKRRSEHWKEDGGCEVIEEWGFVGKRKGTSTKK